MESSFLPRSFRSLTASLGSPSGLDLLLLVAVWDRPRLSDASAAARCSLAGLSCDRSAASTAPSLARFAVRSLGWSRSCFARSRSSLASWARGSVGVTPLLASWSASRSSFSAWAVACSRTARFWAIAAVCGFGRMRVGTSASESARMAMAGRFDIRGLNRFAGTSLRLETASRRWRRTKRRRSSASSTSPAPAAIRASSSAVGGPAASGTVPPSARAVVSRSPSCPSRSTARAVSPRLGRARADTSASATSVAIGTVAAIASIPSIGQILPARKTRSSRPMVAARTIHARRTMRRTHSRRRWGRSPTRTRSSSGSSGPSINRRGSSGTWNADSEGRARRSDGRASFGRDWSNRNIRRTSSDGGDAGSPAGWGASDALV